MREERASSGRKAGRAGAGSRPATASFTTPRSHLAARSEGSGSSALQELARPLGLARLHASSFPRPASAAASPGALTPQRPSTLLSSASAWPCCRRRNRLPRVMAPPSREHRAPPTRPGARLDAGEGHPFKTQPRETSRVEEFKSKKLSSPPRQFLLRARAVEEEGRQGAIFG